MMETDIEDDDLQQGRTRPEKVPDSHLQSPIRIDTRLMIKRQGEDIPNYLRNDVLTCPVDRFHLHLNSERTYGYLFSYAFNKTGEVVTWVRDQYPSNLDSIRRLSRIVLKSLGIEGKDEQMLTEDDLKDLSQKHLWEEIRTTMASESFKKSSWLTIEALPNGIKTMYISKSFCIYSLVETSDSGYYVMDYDQVMMVSDTISSRVFVKLYHHFLPCESPGKLPLILIDQLFTIFDEEIIARGNDAYNHISKWEPICIAVMLKDHDSLKRAASYYKWLESDLKSENALGALKLLYLIENSNLSVFQLAELHGFYRLWGHPTVNEELGCEKVRTIGSNRYHPDPFVLRKMVGAFKRQFVSSFLNKHGKWPNLGDNIALQGKPLYDLIKSQDKNINLYSPLYPLSHWGLLEFSKTFDFDYNLDYTEIIDDKAISCLRSDLRSVYSSESLGYKPPKGKVMRRVLQEILARDTLDIKAICHQIQSLDIPEEWKIILLHAKERELKIAPRLFAMLTLEMRCYFCITEANIASTIFKYLPQQTMTLDESDLSKRMYFLTDTLLLPCLFLAIFFGIDFSSWNLTWTQFSTFQFFSMIDDLLGTPGLYESTHSFFQQCIVSLMSHQNPPSTLVYNPTGDVKECNTLWYNHSGGFEGLRQKGWTTITIALLLLVEHQTGLKSYVIGQGDNQVCKLLIPVPPGFSSTDEYLASSQVEIEQRIDQFMDCLVSNANSIGLTVKMEETWCGCDVISYGKDIMYKGAFLPQGSKRIARTLFDVNEVYPTMHTKISTLQTAGSSCCQKTYDVVPAYELSTMEAITCTMRDMKTLHEEKRVSNDVFKVTTSQSFKEYLLMLSSDIGGYPILSILSFLYRGHPDPLTTYTTFLDLIREDHEIAAKLYKLLCIDLYRRGKGTPELLVSNPCAVNVEVPTTVGTLMRNQLELVLTSITKNKDLKPIFLESRKGLYKEFFEYMTKIKPCHPRIIHEIFRNTVVGSFLTFIGKFSNTRTTQLLFAQREETRSTVERIKKMEADSVNMWVRFYHEVLSIDPQIRYNIKCPTHLARDIRNYSWSEVLDFTEVEGVTIPHPAHQFAIAFLDRSLKTLSASKNIEKSSEEHIIYTSKYNLDYEALKTRGSLPVFVGSITKEKKAGKMFQLPVCSRPISSAERLIQLSQWVVDKASPLYSYLRELAQSRVDLPIELLDLSTSEIIGGSVVHRLDDHVTKRGTLHNTRPNLTTHLYYSTDGMGRLSRGNENYNLHFQGAVHLGFSLIQLYITYGAGRTLRNTKLLYAGHCCEEQLTDFLLQSDNKGPKLGSYETNPLLFTKVAEAPQFIRPTKSSIVKFTKQASPSEAIAYLLFGRCVQNISVYTIGITERSSPPVSSIGVAEILSVGIRSIVKSLALYFILYLPNDLPDIHDTFHNLNDQIFLELASICLLPELRVELKHIPGYCQLPTIFWNVHSMCVLIKRFILVQIDLYLAKSELLKSDLINKPFFPTSSIPISKILFMWARLVQLQTEGTINLFPALRRMNAESEFGVYKLSPEFDSSLSSALIQFLSSDEIYLVAHSYRLHLSIIPAETVARKNRRFLSLKRAKDVTKSVKRKKTYYATENAKIVINRAKYPFEILCSLSGEVTDHKSLLSPKPRVAIPKFREDQVYRLYGGTSTSLLKITEILLKEGWTLEGSAITLAEGEGSIAYLLYKFGCSKIYYDSLIEREKLVPQRATSMVPTYFLSEQNIIQWSDLMLLTGGDLTEYSTLMVLLDSTPVTGVCIVTCDAEITSNMNPDKTMRIVNAWLLFCYRSNTKYALLKTFCQDSTALEDIVAATGSVFTEVKIVVPTYSSHETTEVYIIASGLNPKVTEFDLLMSYQNGYLLRNLSLLNMTQALRDLRDNRRVAKPFQDNKDQMCYEIWNIMKHIGVLDNCPHSLETLVIHNHIYNGIKVTDWIAETMEMCHRRAVQVVTDQASTYYAISYHHIPMEKVSKHLTLHTQLDKYCLAILNCRILQLIIPLTRDKVYHEIVKTVNQGVIITSESVNLYTYSIDVRVWVKSFLKTLWRVWGHHHFRNVHPCLCDWSFESQANVHTS